MKRGLVHLFGCALIAANLHSVAKAADATTTTIETTTEEWVEADSEPEVLNDTPSPSQALAQYGPFHVVAKDRAELIGSIESETPRQFKAMLSAFPEIKQIDIIDCPGTGDDAANFEIARLIHRLGIATNVPNGGSVRSGGVELFLAGAQRKAAPNAEFAVHSWRDKNGREAKDYASNAPENLEYINFYKEIGMDDAKAKAFYAMTNATPHASARYLKGSDLAVYIPLN
jgi:ATP-dependent protease ClpP protease subunit